MEKSFKEKVYEFCRVIPKGKVATYAQIAKFAGKPEAARAVGSFMRINPAVYIIPCHRVVGSDGELTGYSGKGGLTGKRKILLKEGVHFQGTRVDLVKSQWKRF